MSAYHKDEGVYDKAEAHICLTCKMKNCKGVCERLKKEKRKLKIKKDVK